MWNLNNIVPKKNCACPRLFNREMEDESCQLFLNDKSVNGKQEAGTVPFKMNI